MCPLLNLSHANKSFHQSELKRTVFCVQQVPLLRLESLTTKTTVGFYVCLSHHMVKLYPYGPWVSDRDPIIIYSFHSSSFYWTDVQRVICLEEWLTQVYTVNYLWKLQLEPISCVPGQVYKLLPAPITMDTLELRLEKNVDAWRRW